MINSQKLDFSISKEQALVWASSFDEYTFLDSNAYTHGFGLEKFDWILSVSSKDRCFSFNENPIQFLESRTQDYLFFHFAYDFKNALDPLLFSKNNKAFNLPLAHIQCSDLILYAKGGSIYFIEVNRVLSQKDRYDLLNAKLSKSNFEFDVNSRWTKDEYRDAFNRSMEYLQQGDIYEINLCQEFFIENFNVNPELFFVDLNNQAKAPFSACMKLGNYYILSASPERFLQSEDGKLISQPIKGTRPRKWNKEEDQAQIEDLRNSIKETSENKMIVDLVRNDLSYYAKESSVKVNELCKIYSFPNVHQMISTISCELKSKTDMWKAFLKAFPMGSMTGVPKMRCMEIIEELEAFSRESYSGTVGLSFPNFMDSNVLIRSVFYDKEREIGRCGVGGAITIRSEMEEEYEECLVKIRGIVRVLGGDLKL